MRQVGVLRLRGCFALRSSPCAQDDNQKPRAKGQRPTANDAFYPSSFAVIVIFAFSSLDTGHPLLAFSAAF